MTLSGLSINLYTSGNFCAFTVAPGGTADLKLSGDNSLRSGKNRPGWRFRQAPP